MPGGAQHSRENESTERSLFFAAALSGLLLLGSTSSFAREKAPVRIGTPAEAADYGDVILLTVPYGATPQVGRDHGALMAGKIVLDAGNRPERDRRDSGGSSLGSGLAA